MLERLLSRVDHIAANVERVTTAEAGDVKESIKNVREITESIKSLVGTTQGRSRSTGESGARVDRQAAGDDRQPRQDDEEHGDGHRSRSRRGEGTVGRAADRRHHRAATSRTSPRTPAVSSAASPSCRPSSACAPSTTSSPARSRTTCRSQLMPRPDKFYLIELVEDPRGYRDADDHASTTTAQTRERRRIRGSR